MKQVAGSIDRIGTDGFVYIGNDKGGYGFKPSKKVREQVLSIGEDKEVVVHLDVFGVPVKVEKKVQK